MCFLSLLFYFPENKQIFKQLKIFFICWVSIVLYQCEGKIERCNEATASHGFQKLYVITRK